MSIAQKLTTIAENEQKVYEAGRQAEYNELWDNIQTNGTKTDYTNMFAGKAWTTNTFKPKHPIKPKRAQNMFGDSGKIDNDYIKSIDFSECAAMVNCFRNSGVVRLGVVDCSKATKGWNGITQVFYACHSLVEIALFIPPNDTTLPYNSTFGSCTGLKEIRFGGAICQSISFNSCPLTVDSMKDVITHLKNFAGTSNEFTHKVTFSENCWTALEESGNTPNGTTWKEYVQNTLGWNI